VDPLFFLDIAFHWTTRFQHLNVCATDASAVLATGASSTTGWTSTGGAVLHLTPTDAMLPTASSSYSWRTLRSATYARALRICLLFPVAISGAVYHRKRDAAPMTAHNLCLL